MVLTSRFPFPLEKGDKLRIFHQIRLLSRQHEIVLCSLVETHPLPEHIQAVKKYCNKIHLLKLNKASILFNAGLALFKNLPIQVGYFYNKNIAIKINQIAEKENPDHVYCQLVRMAEYARQLPFPKTLDYMDAFSVWAERWAKETSFAAKPIWQRETRKLKLYEKNIAKDFDHLTIISAPDRAHLQLDHDTKVHITPNGIDVDYFTKNKNTEKIYDISFIGNMGYRPNIAAAKYLYYKILPILKQKNPAIKILIAGARPTAEIKKMQDKNVTVTGWLDDIRDAYNQSKIFVAPLFAGSGLQNKILEAMSMELPCVTTPLVNNAIGANEKIISLADTPESFSEKINDLLKNESKIATIKVGGRKFVEDNFSWDTFVGKLNEIIKSNSNKIIKKSI